MTALTLFPILGVALSAALASGVCGTDGSAEAEVGMARNRESVPPPALFEAAAAQPASVTQAPAKPAGRLVLAYHYPWYGYKPPTNWDEQPTVLAHPLLGPYRSADPKLIEFQLALAQEAGIDGFVVSWDGRDTMPDKILRQMLQALDRLSSGFRLCVVQEAWAGKSELSAAKIKADLDYVLSQLATCRSYLRWNGQPVLFVYTPQGWPAANWRQTFESFAQERGARFFTVAVADGWPFDLDYLSAFDTFGPYADKYYTEEALLKSYGQVAAKLHPAGKPLLFSIIGGCSRVQKLGFDFERAQGQYIQYRFRLAQQVQPDWLTVTSWNEWFESMQIEPSQECGFDGIKHVRDMAAKFKGQPLRPLDGAALRLSRAGGGVRGQLILRNIGPQNIYALTGRHQGKEVLRIAYLLRPGASEAVNPNAPLDEVVGFLADGTKVVGRMEAQAP